MAKMIDLQVICSRLNISIPQQSMEAIAASTPNNLNIEEIINILALKEKVTATTLKGAILKAPRPAQEYCGQCREGYINTLDRAKLKAMDENLVIISNPLMLPKAKAHCPNCGTKNDWTIQKVNGSYRDEAGWQWVILYEFAIYQLQHDTAPESFNPREIWPSIDLNPELSNQQLSIMHMIHEAARRRIPLKTNPIPKIIHEAAEQVALPF